MNSFKVKNSHILLVSIVSLLAAAFVLFGSVGFRTIGAIIVLFFIPTYLILDLFSFSRDEKFFFAFFLGIGYFPLAVFYVDRIIPSLRLSILVAYAVIVVIWFYAKKRDNFTKSR